METVDEPVGWFTHFYRRVSVLRWASVCNLTWVSVFWCFLVTYRHTDFILQCLPPPCGEKSAAATDLSFQAVTKERPPSVPGLSVLLMGQQKYHLFGPSKESTRSPHPKSVSSQSQIIACIYSLVDACSLSLWIQMWPWMPHCVSALEQVAAWCFDGQLTNI